MSTLDWKQIQREAEVFDLHIHPSMQQQLFQRNLGVRSVINRSLHGDPMSVRASFPRLRDGGYSAFLSTMYVPEKGLRKDFPLINVFRFLRPDLWKKLIVSQPFDATLKIMGDMEKAVIETSGYGWVKMACSVKELDEIYAMPRDNRPIAAIHAVEGAHSLGGESASDEAVMRNLEALFNRGVISITLAHFYPNRVIHPCYPFPEDISRLAKHPNMWRDLTKGLTDLGKKVVERMVDMGMLIDVSHSTPAARRDIYDIIDATGKQIPVLATHVGAYEINPSPYNLPDWEIKRIARDGGVAGVIFMPYWLMAKESRQGINYISRHIAYFMEVGGENFVGLGTDFDGFTTPPDDLDNASLIHRLTERLVIDGYTAEQIKKILGGNALRAVREGWGKKI